jgi:hypothetical protein
MHFLRVAPLNTARLRAYPARYAVFSCVKKKNLNRAVDISGVGLSGRSVHRLSEIFLSQWPIKRKEARSTPLNHSSVAVENPTLTVLLRRALSLRVVELVRCGVETVGRQAYVQSPYFRWISLCYLDIYSVLVSFTCFAR